MLHNTRKTQGFAARLQVAALSGVYRYNRRHF